MKDFIKETVFPAIMCLMLGLGFGLLLRQEQLEINTQLKLEYNELRRNYDELKSVPLRYDVDGDGQVTAADYVAIKNYIMEENNE